VNAQSINTVASKYIGRTTNQETNTCNYSTPRLTNLIS